MTLKLIGELAEWIDNHHDVLGTVVVEMCRGNENTSELL